jgi:hypothetical protein
MISIPKRVFLLLLAMGVWITAWIEDFQLGDVAGLEDVAYWVEAVDGGCWRHD